MSLKGEGKRKAKTSFTQEELYKVFTQFEKTRISKAEKQLGRTGLKQDPFAKFVVERTELCPHRLITANTSYWLDTAYLFDTEQGLNLPCAMECLPGLFFDAISIVRTARATVRKEEAK